MRDIAERLEISQAAVSLALRNSREVSPALCKRVQQTAEKMGYRPDPLLSSLSHYRRSKTPMTVGQALAWINIWDPPEQLRELKEFDLYWKGAEAEAEKAGYRLDEFVVNDDLTPKRLEKILISRGITGLLLPPATKHNFPLKWKDFNWDSFCLIRFGYSFTDLETHVITSDQYANSELACEQIRNRGYRRIGYVDNLARPKHWRFAGGFLSTSYRNEQFAIIPPLLIDVKAPAQARRQVATWLKKHKLDAIFSPIPEIRKILNDIGLRVPEDVGLATTSVLDGNVDAGIYQNSEEIGRTAVKLLISLIHHNERGIPEFCHETFVKGSWVDGSTLPSRLGRI